ncbi:MAG: malonic semialdehyde reductase [Pseudomonadota bacterium]
MSDQMLSDADLDILFRSARTHRAWLDREVSDVLLQAVYDLAKFGPTSANCCPLRVVFVKSKEAKERLKPALAKGNVEKTMSAPVTAIIAFDEDYHLLWPRLAPFMGDQVAKQSDPTVLWTELVRNGSLQGAYFILAARSLGLDCGPMSGFKNSMVDELFFAGTSYKSNFLCNLGYGDHGKLHPRLPRLSFDEVCRIL